MYRVINKVIWAIICFSSLAWGQLTPEQLKLQEELLKGRGNDAVRQADVIEQYKSPVKFTEQDPQFYAPPEGSQPPAKISDRQDIKTTAEEGLTIFGYNMFDGTPESYSPVLEATPPSDYKLGPGDNILVNLWGRVEMQLDLTVDREGTVFIPKAGEIAAWGVTLDEFRDNLNRRLGGIYSDYQLSVTLGKIRRIKVFVYGEVKRPGGYTTSSLTTLFNALYLAGGPSQTGSLRKIKHLRSNKVLAEIDLYRFLIEGDNSQDSRLESGDVVFVPVVGPLVRIVGQVKREAIYEICGGEKITDLIGLAGKTTAEAFLEKISVDRIGGGDNRIIQDVDLSEGLKLDNPQAYALADFHLRDGDRIKVPSIFDLRKNTVKLMGNVKHPGIYGLADSMRISDLIDHGAQLRNNTHLARANLFRTYPDQRREVYPVNLDEILSGIDSTNYYLIDTDSIAVYSENEIKRDMTVTIYGAVKRPGKYEYFDNMRLSDLVFLAGNALKQSYLLQAEIARSNPGRTDEVIHANLESALSTKGSAQDLCLTEDDKVYIRTIPRWSTENNVTIDGEVMFPGAYTLSRDGERLSDMIQRCGGFTPDAFEEGLVFVRGSILEDIEKRHIRTILASTETTILDSLNRPLPKLDQTVDLQSANRIIINVEEALKNPKSPDNVALQRGDYIYVPRKPAGVQVLGAVAMNGTIVFKKGKSADYYIKSSGGFSKNADKGQTRLAKSNGRVLSGGKAFQTNVEAGDIVLVPQKIKRDRHWLKSGSSIAAIASSAVTAFLVIDRLR